MGITEALAKREHQVTMVSSFEPSKTIENIREVVVQNFTLDHLMTNVFDESEQSKMMFSMFTETPALCVKALGQPHIQALKNEKFDLVIVSAFLGSCFLSFVHHLKVPFIWATPSGLMGSFHNRIGSIDVPAISGCKLLEPGFPLTFKQRLTTTMVNELIGKLFQFYMEPKSRSLCVESGLCPVDTPPFSEFDKNASLLIINSVRTLEYPPRPGMPNAIYVGGAHIKPPKKLPKDLEDFVKGSGDEGFIFFSLGSAVNPDFLPEKYRAILVKVFGSLKQRVLWKWNEETMPDLPSNVKLQKWLPQPDLLGHPKIKLFITHGGLLSTLESSYHGVPVIGIPVFGDQTTNMMEVENEGWGRVMRWKELEENTLRELILDVLNNKKTDWFLLMKKAAYWVEYVIRHNGAPHLRSPVFRMKWYEVYNIDVWAFIIFVIVGTLFVSYLFIKFFLRKCFGIGKSRKDKKKVE
ncbi:UDP-glucuronosyltransferase [Armadillidium nasatum]|uniref:UDP-glucuronosyltransferase n=1 Tax=Armadillidium nasatum TaxID=96803 RepID=A0A5N5TH65_9CRUS|nr:UDP-glucuronosyltransferase [Armadillidium nasatum]